MYSSLSLWASSVTDPKARLASYLAQVLSAFFVDVDANQIESSLLTNAKIVLQDVRVCPYQLDRCCILSSHVNEMALQWTWGGADDGSTNFVRETCLTIRGVRFRVSFTDENKPAASRRHEMHPYNECILKPPDFSNITTTLTGNDHHEQTYVERHVQQILDHLRVLISDIELAIEKPTSVAQEETIVIHANALEFVSFGREKAEPMSLEERMSLSTMPQSPSPLTQRISLDSLRADLQVFDERGAIPKESLPILQPFGYAASVRGDAGRKVFDGDDDRMLGVEIVGEESDSLTLCVGPKQFQVLEQLLERLFSGGEENPDSSKVCGFIGAASAEETDCGKKQWSFPSPSTFYLPFPSIRLVLPNGSSLHLPDCVVHYRTDGTRFHITGSKGIRVDHGNHDFLELCGEGTRWVADIVKRSFVLEAQVDDDSSNTEEVFYDAQAELSSHLPEMEFKPVMRLHWHDDVKQMAYGFLQTAELM